MASVRGHWRTASLVSAWQTGHFRVAIIVFIAVWQTQLFGVREVNVVIIGTLQTWLQAKGQTWPLAHCKRGQFRMENVVMCEL